MKGSHIVNSCSKPCPAALAPEVLLAKTEPVVESLEAIGTESGPKGGRVGRSSQPVGCGGSPESVGRLQPRVEEVEPVEGIVIAVLESLGSLGLPGTDHLYKTFWIGQLFSLWRIKLLYKHLFKTELERYIAIHKRSLEFDL